MLFLVESGWNTQKAVKQVKGIAAHSEDVVKFCCSQQHAIQHACNPVITPSIHPESPYYPFLLDGCRNSSHSQLVVLAAPLLDDTSSFSVQFLLLELYNGTHKDSGSKEDLEER